ncbi:MAG TPA: SEC-C metal-binding domain-containing protein [Pyrinomonadaceae bacterium]|nr:SEC-C metal-binding domain-containing protein [Pyrinomonadaceae bacterium]
MDPIRKSVGTTSTERYLAKACERTFLSLWSYPNPYTPRGKKGGRGFGKELCDLLVVFDSHILIFSDKDIHFDIDVEIEVAWNRWRKRSIDKSISQLHGAERWIKNNPGEIYLDPACENRFPLDLVKLAPHQIHLIAVTKNSHKHAKKHFGGGSSGSFMLIPASAAKQVSNSPFVLSDTTQSKTYVHVFDEVTLDTLFEELDTISDFVSYLSAKEKGIRNGCLQVISGEEELLAYYIMNGGPIKPNQFRFEDTELARKFNSFSIGEGFWAHYASSSERAAIKRANEGSYFWDSLIEQFASHILAGSVPIDLDKYFLRNEFVSHEQAIRWMARENRMARRMLSKDFVEKMQTTFKDRRTSRICFSPFNKNACFILVIYPRNPGEDYSMYRNERVDILFGYALACKLRFPDVTEVTLIGTEPAESEGRSEDVLALEMGPLSEANKKAALEMVRRDRILQEGTTWIREESLAKAEGMDDIGPPIQHLKKLGRNDRCPCGSGRKYKKCCLT